MSKKWIYLLAVAVLVIPSILTACAPTAAPAPTTAPVAEEPTTAPVAPEVPVVAGPYEDVDPSGATLLWWHQHTRERQEGLNQMVEEFNQSNEWGITVQAEYAGGYPEIYDKMIAAIATGDSSLLPNLVSHYPNGLAKFQLSEALVDLDELIASPKWGLTDEELADFFPGTLEANVNPQFGDGHFQLAFPVQNSMEVMYYNLTWLKEMGYDGPPKTWAEFGEMVCQATDKAAGTIGYEISTDASRFASMVFSRHGSYYFEDGSAFSFTNPTVKETMTFMKDLFDQGCIALIAEAYGDQTDFGNYKTLFTIGSSSGLPYYDRAVKSGEKGEFEWGVAPLPYMDGGNEPVMNIYGAPIGMAKTTPKEELAAWLFLKWFAAPEQNARWAIISNYFPVRFGAVDLMGDYLAEDPTYQAAFDLLPYATFEAQWCACYEDVRRMMSNAYNAILDGDDIDATLAQLEADANVSLAENSPGGVTPAPDLLGFVKLAKKLVVSTDPNYAPQSFLNDQGELDGFDIEVAKEVAKRLGVQAEFVTPDWEMITPGNWAGRWDISIGSMTPTEPRAEVLWFTDPYYYTPAAFAVHKDNTTIQTPEDLTGKKLGLGTATTYEDYLNNKLAMMGGVIAYDPPPGINITAYSTDSEAIQDLALGDGVRLDAVMSAQPTIQQAIDSGVPLKYVGTPAFYEPLAFALDRSRGKSDQMLGELNKIIAAMHEEGVLSELALKWYGIDRSQVVEAEAPVGAGGTFIFGRGGDSVQLDPAIVTDGESFRVTGQCLEPLYQYEPGSTVPIPALATECTANEAGTEWTCKLRQGVKFHDGTDFNADAVIWNFERWRFTDHPQHYASQVFEYYEYMWFGFDDDSLIKSVDKIDDYTVKFVLGAPLAPFLANLAMDIFAISSPAAVQAAGEDYGTPKAGCVGTGPFIFKEWVEGSSITVTANPDYWGGKPSIDQIIWQVIPDDSARFLALKAGSIHALETATVEDLASAEADPDLYVATRPALNTGYLAFNYKIEEFRDIKVRQAVAHAINREAIVEAFLGDYGQVAKTFLPPLIWGHDATMEDWAYDPALARQLLADAGFPDGLSQVTVAEDVLDAEGNVAYKAGDKIPLRLYYMPVTRFYYPSPKEIGEAMSADLARAGFDITMELAGDWSTYLGLRRQGQLMGLYMLGWGGDNGDPDNFLNYFFGGLSGPGQIKEPDKREGWYANQEVAELCYQAAVTVGQENREVLYKQIERLLHDDVARLWVDHYNTPLIFSNKVSGYVPQPVGADYYEGVVLEQ
jgi:peptide/nickel transport system substrate-binding protein